MTFGARLTTATVWYASFLNERTRKTKATSSLAARLCAHIGAFSELEIGFESRKLRGSLASGRARSPSTIEFGLARNLELRFSRKVAERSEGSNSRIGRSLANFPGIAPPALQSSPPETFLGESIEGGTNRRKGPEVSTVTSSEGSRQQFREKVLSPATTVLRSRWGYTTAFGCLNMPGCAAVGCNNRSEKGYIMKCFPRDPKLRKIWQERVARADWEPSNNSFLCHVHFEPQEWSITQSGRIRLKKNAIPSIFTITSTRKSPKKRTKVINNKNKNDCQDEFAIEFLEHDSERSSIGHLEEKDSDYQDTDEPALSFSKSNKYLSNSQMAGKPQTFQKSCQPVNSNVGDDGMTMISDDNILESDKPIKQDTLNRKENENNMTTSHCGSDEISEDKQIIATIIKQEVKPENISDKMYDDSYDEIEKKLKQICDGACTGDENYNNDDAAHPAVTALVGGEKKLVSNFKSENAECDAALSPNVNHSCLATNEIGHMLIDKRENVEIIFGTESGDEKGHTAQSISHDKCSVTNVENVVDSSLCIEDIICVKEEDKTFVDDIKENFGKDEIHVLPNMRAAMKRKRRTREEIMKSIKKSIKSVPEHEGNSSSNSDVLDNTERELDTTTGKPSVSAHSTENVKQDDAEMETAQFIIKVTGDPSDVNDIIQELASNAPENTVPQKFSVPYECEGPNTFVTSVITVLSPKNFKVSDDQSILHVKEEFRISNHQPSEVNLSPCSEQPLHLNQSFIEMRGLDPDETYSRLKNNMPCSDQEDQNFITNASLETQSFAYNTERSLENNSVCYNSYDYEHLQERIRIQENVIEKLTDQLIKYKNLENSLQNRSTAREGELREAEAVTHKMNTRSTSALLSISNKKNLESKQRLIEELSNRINYFEETNKKLMKTVTLESQQKRKLEGQIKQRDNRIKELNWKLEKASKYLDRAEKNTNTYRRKMLNMQTIMRRKKLLDEKMSRFNEMLIDSAKQEFSEKALSIAIEIRKASGKIGYNKLLNYGFPLPPLPALRKQCISEDFSDHNESEINRLPNISKKLISKGDKLRTIKSDMEIDTKDSGIPESATKESDFDGAETITGTVQDIFDENNDGSGFQY
ncbi:hypothetical protein KM043_006490 [Ampulex compressa]|nr:hypothetical protein KM043_006490 [Ampulex compressa]